MRDLGLRIFLSILSYAQASSGQNATSTNKSREIGGWESLGLNPNISESFRKNLVKALAVERELVLKTILHRQSEDGDGDGPDIEPPDPADPSPFDYLAGLYGVISGLTSWNSTRVFQSAVNFFPPDERPAAQMGVDNLVQMFPPQMPRPMNQNGSFPERLTNAFINVLYSNLTTNPTQNVTSQTLAPVVMDAVVSAFNDSRNDQAVIVRPIMEMLVSGLMRLPSLFINNVNANANNYMPPNYNPYVMAHHWNQQMQQQQQQQQQPGNGNGNGFVQDPIPTIPPMPSIHQTFPYPGQSQPILPPSSTFSFPISTTSAPKRTTTEEYVNEVEIEAEVVFSPILALSTTRIPTSSPKPPPEPEPESPSTFIDPETLSSLFIIRYPSYSISSLPEGTESASVSGYPNSAPPPPPPAPPTTEKSGNGQQQIIHWLPSSPDKDEDASFNSIATIIKNLNRTTTVSSNFISTAAIDVPSSSAGCCKTICYKNFCYKLDPITGIKTPVRLGAI